jgi:hypothetical protein
MSAYQWSEMRASYFWLSIFLLGCKAEKNVKSDLSASSTAELSVSRDTTGLGAQVDSVLDSVREGGPNTLITAHDDTVTDFDGVILAGSDSAGWYALDVYSVNHARYARVKKNVGRTADGFMTWSTQARALFPSTDSTQTVVRECRQGDSTNPYVFGIAAVYAKVPDWHPVRAWRFDAETKTVKEIPAAGLVCARMLREE